MFKQILLGMMMLILVPGFAQTGGAVFEVGPTMNYAKIVPMTAVLDDGRVATFGGREFNFVSGINAEFYDYETNAFTALTMGVPRDAGTIVKLANGNYLLIGGGYDWGIPAYDNNEVFNPNDNSFSSAGTMLYPRMQCGAAELSSGAVLIIGGWYNNNAATFAEKYNYNTNSYTAAGALNVPRAQAFVLPANDGGAIICGGWGSYGGSYITTVEYYNAEDNIFEIYSAELINEDPGWYLWNVNRPVSDYTLPNGKIVLLAYRNAPEIAYGVITYDPETKTFEKLQEFVLADLALINGGFYDMAIDRENGFAYLLGLESGSDPVNVGVISMDLLNNIAYYPDDIYTLPVGDYLFPTLAFIPGNGKVLLMGVSTSPSDYFNATYKTYLFKPDYSVAITGTTVEKSKFICYPNPTGGDLNVAISINEPGPYIIQVVNMQGVIVYSEIRNENNRGLNNWQFNKLMLPQGMYMLTVKGESFEAESPLIIAY
jgi:hypothetical protein